MIMEGSWFQAISVHGKKDNEFCRRRKRICRRSKYNNQYTTRKNCQGNTIRVQKHNLLNFSKSSVTNVNCVFIQITI